MKEYHVILSIDDKTGEYSKFAGTTIASIFENTKENICIHLFHSENLSVKNKINFNELAKIYNQKIIYHLIRLPDSLKNMKMISEGFLSEASLYRLDVVNQIKNEERVLYLDCDIIVDGDIKQLFDIDINNNYLAAVRDPGIERNFNFYKKNMPKINPKKYFNAGVIIFNLDKIKKEKINLFEQSKMFFRKYPKDPFSDQSALNYIFRDKVYFLTKTYNSFPHRNSRIGDSVIWHFAGANKPWETRFSEVDKLFWKYYRLTPWGRNIDDVFELYSKVVDSLDFALLHYPSGPKRQFFKNIFIRVFRELKEIKNNYL